MKSIMMLFAVMGLITASIGCTTCQSPYDYCGPTFTGKDGTCCSCKGRANSILSEPIDYVGCPVGGCQETVHPTPAMTPSRLHSRVPSGNARFPSKADLERMEGGAIEILNETDVLLEQPINSTSQGIKPDGAYYHRSSSYQPAQNAARWRSRAVR